VFLGLRDTHAVLGFRGSDPLTLPNWMTDAIVQLVACEEYQGRVHLGFSSVLKRTWGKVERVLERLGERPLFLTGHSMGGAPGRAGPAAGRDGHVRLPAVR
jgi:hypothetical protein